MMRWPIKPVPPVTMIDISVSGYQGWGLTGLEYISCPDRNTNMIQTLIQPLHASLAILGI